MRDITVLGHFDNGRFDWLIVKITANMGMNAAGTDNSSSCQGESGGWTAPLVDEELQWRTFPDYSDYRLVKLVQSSDS